MTEYSSSSHSDLTLSPNLFVLTLVWFYLPFTMTYGADKQHDFQEPLTPKRTWRRSSKLSAPVFCPEKPTRSPPANQQAAMTEDGGGQTEDGGGQRKLVFVLKSDPAKNCSILASLPVWALTEALFIPEFPLRAELPCSRC